mmetsp:Transcript_32102/g.91028  ORF Transcript_32102/g.91028 Transcript_32102/m.91028 type:complete len:271 (-) Transcript_32102:90-902(-)
MQSLDLKRAAVFGFCLCELQRRLHVVSCPLEKLGRQYKNPGVDGLAWDGDAAPGVGTRGNADAHHVELLPMPVAFARLAYLWLPKPPPLACCALWALRDPGRLAAAGLAGFASHAHCLARFAALLEGHRGQLLRPQDRLLEGDVEQNVILLPALLRSTGIVHGSLVRVAEDFICCDQLLKLVLGRRLLLIALPSQLVRVIPQNQLAVHLLQLIFRSVWRNPKLFIQVHIVLHCFVHLGPAMQIQRPPAPSLILGSGEATCARAPAVGGTM